ncbi:MAG: carbohydrate ABC transporter permease [Spirochaetaceae bacterium]|jgi:multiple sugar transport system permease protein|nr:carbohydrate ABC transporter permease [Spirochaetaceae bacterium]
MKHTPSIRIPWFQIVVFLIALVLLLLTFVPVFTMLFLSLKSTVQIYGDFFALPNPIEWGNYNKAIGMLIPNMINTLLVVSAGTALTLALCMMSGYVFARLNFPLKNFLYMAVIALMMVPGILLLTPQYSLVQKYGMYNTWWALVLPWASGGQIFGILLCRTSVAQLPGEMFESARMDGCGELRALVKIALPLSKPILSTIAVMNMVAFYNDFIWPLLVIENNSKQVINVVIRVFQTMTGTVDLGSMVAGFVFATIPLLVLFIFTSRLYIEGITSGAIKA